MENVSSGLRVALILGGARSGKSRYGLGLAARLPSPRLFVATCEPRDPEMEARINAHQRERGSDWVTLETPLQLVETLAGTPLSMAAFSAGRPKASHPIGCSTLNPRIHL